MQTIEKKRYGDLTVHYIDAPQCQTFICKHCGYACNDPYDFEKLESHGTCGSCYSTFYKKITLGLGDDLLSSVIAQQEWKEYIARRFYMKSV